ncbi:MAG: formylglycine-generating enzyme family protein, partial [Desulfamplus sp.]|nr:formylglycine-generating enzyme family protein [Desulfamplus sp.]
MQNYHLKTHIFIGTVLSLIIFGFTVQNSAGSAAINTNRFPSAGEKKTLSLNGAVFTMVYIPAGTFIREIQADPEKSSMDATQQKVTLSKGFWMGDTPVTQQLWKAVMGSNPSYFTNCGRNCPVENVSWYDAHEFITRINQLMFKGAGTFRLPTEAEWEYAAQSDNPDQSDLNSIAWYAENSYVSYDNAFNCAPWFEDSPPGTYCGTQPVGQKQANSWGLYDMVGNIWEWTNDWYAPYSEVDSKDPEGSHAGYWKVNRGCSWRSLGNYCNPLIRGRTVPHIKTNDIGLR